MKRYGLLLITVMILLVFAACSDNGAEPTESEPTATIAEIAATPPSEITTEPSMEEIEQSVTESTEMTAVTVVSTTTAQTQRSTTSTMAQSIIPTTTQTTTTAVTTTAVTTVSTTTAPTTTLPAFDINNCIQFAKDYAVSIGLKLDKGTMGTWDTPLAAGPTLKYTERDIISSMDWYKREGCTAVWVWAEKRPNSDKYDVYISRG